MVNNTILKLKNWAIILCALVFSFTVVGVSAIRVSQAQVQKDIGADNVSPAPSEITAEQAKTENKVEYYLAYPGILPDHPLYWLKMLRDRFMLWLATDSTLKTDKLLLYADKRLGAAKVLVEGGKVQLGITTATKGEKYLEQAISQYNKTAAAGKNNAELKTKLSNATMKHVEVLTTMLPKTTDSTKTVLEELINKTKQFVIK
jgi:hypothetical protein